MPIHHNHMPAHRKDIQKSFIIIYNFVCVLFNLITKFVLFSLQTLQHPNQQTTAQHDKHHNTDAASFAIVHLRPSTNPDFWPNNIQERSTRQLTNDNRSEHLQIHHHLKFSSLTLICKLNKWSFNLTDCG